MKESWKRSEKRVLRDCWETAERLLRDCWEADKRLLEDMSKNYEDWAKNSTLSHTQTDWLLELKVGAKQMLYVSNVESHHYLSLILKGEIRNKNHTILHVSHSLFFSWYIRMLTWPELEKEKEKDVLKEESSCWLLSKCVRSAIVD